MLTEKNTIERFCNLHKVFLLNGVLEDSASKKPVSADTFCCETTYTSKHRMGDPIEGTEGSMAYCPFKTATEAKEGCPAYEEINWFGKFRNRIIY